MIFPGQQDGKFLRSFEDRVNEYEECGAKVLAVVDHPSRVSGLAQTYETVIDPAGEIRQKYTGLMDSSLVSQNDSLVYVLNQYNAPYSALVGAAIQTEAGIPDTGSEVPSEEQVHEGIQRWLEYIGIQCPE